MKTFEWIFILLFVLAISSLVFILILEKDRINAAMDNFCIENGANKHTDSLYGALDLDRYKIECDNGVIYNVVRVDVCVKIDKWLRCIKERPTFMYGAQ